MTNSITDIDLDAIESIDTEPEVVTDSIAFVPENMTGTKVEMRRHQSGGIPEERYLSLIASSPSTSIHIETPDEEISLPMNNPTLTNAQKIISNTRRSLTDLIVPAQELSDTLSSPRKPNIRRENEYVKTRPNIEKLRFSTTSTSAGIVRETPL